MQRCWLAFRSQKSCCQKQNRLLSNSLAYGDAVYRPGDRGCTKRSRRRSPDRGPWRPVVCRHPFAERRKLLGAKARFPRQPDTLLDPKRHLLGLARLDKREVRDDLLRATGSVAAQGIGYNNRLTSLVATDWSRERAGQRSPSLARARRRLRELAERVLNN